MRGGASGNGTLLPPPKTESSFSGSLRLVTIAAAQDFCVAIASDGAVLRHESAGAQAAWSPVLTASGKPLRGASVSCGKAHAVIKGTDGRAYSFGSDEHMQLGLGPPQPGEAPRAQHFAQAQEARPWGGGPRRGAELVLDVVAGGDFSFFLVETTPLATQQLQGGRGTELGGLKKRELRQAAREAGVDLESMDEADDSEDPKAALVQLILQREAAASPRPAAAAAAQPSGQAQLVLYGCGFGSYGALGNGMRMHAQVRYGPVPPAPNFPGPRIYSRTQ